MKFQAKLKTYRHPKLSTFVDEQNLITTYSVKVIITGTFCILNSTTLKLQYLKLVRKESVPLQREIFQLGPHIGIQDKVHRTMYNVLLSQTRYITRGSTQENQKCEIFSKFTRLPA